MATYASAELLAEYVAGNALVRLPEGEDVERLLERAERDVDRVLGPYPPDPATGLKFDPGELTTAQRGALARATCAAAEFVLAQGPELLTGADDGVAAAGSVSYSLRPAPRQAPRLLEELAGHGLIARTLTALPTQDADAGALP